MDEKRISALFEDAVGDVPAPTFGTGDIAAESARLTRKRNGLLAGSALGFALLVGGTTTGVALLTGPNGGSGNDTASVASDHVPERNDGPAPYDLPGDSAQERAVTPTDLPESTPKQGGSTLGSAGSEPGGTPPGCGPAAGEFVAALADELPAATSLGEPVISPLTCPAGGVSVAVPVADGPRKGLLSVMLVPADATFAVQPPWADRPSGAAGAVVIAKSGKQLVVVIEPVPGSAAPPLDTADARELADGLGSRY